MVTGASSDTIRTGREVVGCKVVVVSNVEDEVSRGVGGRYWPWLGVCGV